MFNVILTREELENLKAWAAFGQRVQMQLCFGACLTCKMLSP